VKRYWVDSGAIIWANRDLFPLDSVRGYWNWLESKMNDGHIVTHKRVYKEIIAGAVGERPDPIAVWVKQRKDKGLNYECTAESKVLVGEISAYALDRYGFETAKAFLSGADPFLIARTAVDGGTVVTQESVTKQPRIPSICAKFKVDCIPLTRMNIELKMKF